jgi:hypothetical protein
LAVDKLVSGVVIALIIAANLATATNRWGWLDKWTAFQMQLPWPMRFGTIKKAEDLRVASQRFAVAVVFVLSAVLVLVLVH